jgi:hypothetical protein
MIRSLRSAAALAAFAISLFAPTIAFASPNDDCRGDAACLAHADADRLFAEGRAAMKRSDFAKARELLLESEAREAAAGTELNLAICEEQLGQLARAYAHYRLAYERMPDGDPRKAPTRQSADALVPRIGFLTLKPPTGIDARHVTVLVGGEAASLSTRIPLDPGRVGIVVRVPEHKDNDVTLDVRAGDDVVVAVVPGERIETRVDGPAAAVSGGAPASPALPATPPRDVPSPEPPRWPAYVVGGVGVVGLVLGGFAALRVLDAKSVMNSDCPNKVCRTQAAYDTVNGGSTWSTVGTIGVATGVVALATATVLFLRSGTPATTRATTSRFDVQVVPGLGGGMVLIGGNVP